jgi:hypothetical protein
MPLHISNPFGAHVPVTTFASGVDADGQPFYQPSAIQEYRANAAVARGDVVQWVAATASVPLSVAAMATASSALIFAGVALNSAATGETVQVAQHGHVLVRTGDITTALGEYLLKPSTTAGVGVTSNTAIDATTVAGSILGVVVGNDDGTFTPVFLTRF